MSGAKCGSLHWPLVRAERRAGLTGRAAGGCVQRGLRFALFAPFASFASFALLAAMPAMAAAKPSGNLPFAFEATWDLVYPQESTPAPIPLPPGPEAQPAPAAEAAQTESSGDSDSPESLQATPQAQEPGAGSGLVPVPISAQLQPRPEALKALPKAAVEDEAAPAPAAVPVADLPLATSRLEALEGRSRGSVGRPEFEAGEPFDWHIQCEHAAGVLPRFEPAQLSASGGPLDPDSGWALLSPAEFAPAERLPDGRYRSRAVLRVAALAGGVQTGESGRTRVPERRLPDLRIVFELQAGSAESGAGAGPAAGSTVAPESGGQKGAVGAAGAGLQTAGNGGPVANPASGSKASGDRPDFRAPPRPAGLAIELPGDLRVLGPELAVQSLLDGQSGPHGLRPVLTPEPPVSTLVAWRRAALVSLLAGVGLIFALRGLLKPLEVPPPAPRPPSLPERLARARRLLEERPNAPPARELYFELSSLLRAGLGQRTGRGLSGHTDEEWLASQGEALAPGERQELEQLLRRLARAKYGNESLSPWAAGELLAACEARLAPPAEVRA